MTNHDHSTTAQLGFDALLADADSDNRAREFEREIVARWDICEIAQDRARVLQEDDPDLSDDDAFQQACLDNDIIQMEWDWLLEDFEPVLRDLSPDGWFHVEGRNMGWRRRTGWKTLRAETAQHFFDQTLPDTDCTFVIEREGPMLHITNYHHDAPTGEFYTVVAGEPDAESPP